VVLVVSGVSNRDFWKPLKLKYMKMLFLFDSIEGFNRYLPILTALLEKGYTVSTCIASESKNNSFRTQTVTEEKRLKTWREVKDRTWDVLFAEQEFALLGIGRAYKEYLLEPGSTLADVMNHIEKHHSYAVA
jgi:hypothetical protein